MGTDRISNDTGKPHYMVKYSPIHRCKPHITNYKLYAKRPAFGLVFLSLIVHSKYDIL